jgi:hypothetical protein
MKVNTQEDAVVRINQLRTQLGQPVLTVGDDEVVYLENLLESIDALESQVAQSAAEPRAMTKEPSVTPSDATPVELGSKIVAPTLPHVAPLLMRRNYASEPQDADFVLHGRRPQGTYGLARAIQAATKTKAINADASKVTGLQRAIAANIAKQK